MGGGGSFDNSNFMRRLEITLIERNRTVFDRRVMIDCNTLVMGVTVQSFVNTNSNLNMIIFANK